MEITKSIIRLLIQYLVHVGGSSSKQQLLTLFGACQLRCVQKLTVFIALRTHFRLYKNQDDFGYSTLASCKHSSATVDQRTWHHAMAQSDTKSPISHSCLGWVPACGVEIKFLKVLIRRKNSNLHQKRVRKAEKGNPRSRHLNFCLRSAVQLKHKGSTRWLSTAKFSLEGLRKK